MKDLKIISSYLKFSFSFHIFENDLDKIIISFQLV